MDSTNLSKQWNLHISLSSILSAIFHLNLIKKEVIAFNY